MPNAYSAVGPGSSLEQSMAVINGNFARLDAEVVTKTFRNANGKNGLVMGRQADGTLGIILNDNDGNPAIVINIDASGTPQIETLRADGSVAKRTVRDTDFRYDSNGVNYMQDGTLPDGSEGFVLAKPGTNVADLFA